MTEIAACSGRDPEMWFPKRPDLLEEVARAQAVCEGCPIKTPCREHALDNKERYGIWGGLTENERLQLLQDRPSRTPKPRPKTRPQKQSLSSEVRGVAWIWWRSRWEVVIHCNKKKHYGGTHKDKETAEAKALIMHKSLGTNPARAGGG